MTRRKTELFFVISLVAVLALLWRQYEPQNPSPEPTPTLLGVWQDRADGLKIQVTEDSDGQTCRAGDYVHITASGTLPSGEAIATCSPGTLIHWELDSTRVIKGLDEGVQGMKIGERRRIEIPPSLGYGQKSVANIPPNSNMTYDVVLEKIETSPES